jgi:hypothetical protein
MTCFFKVSGKFLSNLTSGTGYRCDFTNLYTFSWYSLFHFTLARFINYFKCPNVRLHITRSHVAQFFRQTAARPISCSLILIAISWCCDCYKLKQLTHLSYCRYFRYWSIVTNETISKFNKYIVITW